MEKELQYVYAEQIFDIKFFVIEHGKLKMVEDCQLKHIPQKGDYYILSSPEFKGSYKIMEIAHNETESYIFLSEEESVFSELVKKD